MSQVYFTVKLIRPCIGPCARDGITAAPIRKGIASKTFVVSVQTEAAQPAGESDFFAGSSKKVRCLANILRL